MFGFGASDGGLVVWRAREESETGRFGKQCVNGGSDGIARVGSSRHDLGSVLRGNEWCCVVLCCAGAAGLHRHRHDRGESPKTGKSRKYGLGPLKLDGGTAGDAGGDDAVVVARVLVMMARVQVVQMVRGRRVRGDGWIWWLGIHEPGVGCQAGSLCSIWPHLLLAALVCRAESFPQKCPFDTRFLAPLAKVIHPVVHSAYRLSQVGATPARRQPLAASTPAPC
jgi:hypothetical protein